MMKNDRLLLFALLCLALISSCTGGSNNAGTNSSGASLASIAITPVNRTIAANTGIHYLAVGTYSDNTIHDLTESVSWSSSAQAVATISNTAGSRGQASAVGPGSTMITATSGTLSGSTTLNVTSATLVSITISPFNASNAPGTSRQFTATAVYSDNTHQDITSQVSWSSLNTSVATITNTGLATAVALGTSLITASDAASGISSSVTLAVAQITLSAISILPANPTVSSGNTVQLTALGTYSDGSTQDITNTVTWSSNYPTAITMSNTAGTNGQATTLPGVTGQIMVTVTDPATGVSKFTTVTITAPYITSIAVTPATASIFNGFTRQFKATATLTDSSTVDMTNSVTWSSSDTGVASISNMSGSNGLATSLSEGVATIKAKDPQGGASGTATLTVTPATLVSISVTPTDAVIVAGFNQQFKATGTYTDGSTKDITNSVTWSSSNASAALVSNATGSQGLATSVAAGLTAIKATDASSSINGSTTLSVTAATLVSFAINPVSPTIYKSSTTQFTATATYTDSSTSDITSQVTWTSSDPTVAGINNTGLAFSAGAGATTITAAYNGTSINTALNVIVNTANVIAISAGNGHTMALKSDGTVWTWGNDYSGQLGIGITDGSNSNPYPTPWEVNGLTSVIAVSAGDQHSMALKSDGTVWAWGNNYSGELGNGTKTYSNTPQQVSGLSNIIAIAAGHFYSLALTADNTVWAWGQNDQGQLGNGTTTDSLVPVQVSGLSGVTAITAGYNFNYYAVALKSDGTVWAWGRNDNGQLGNGTTTNSSVPVQVSGLTNITKISTGGGQTLALKSDGTLWAWGSNGCGQTGQPATGWCGNFWNTVPVQVSGLSNIQAIAAGAGDSVALESDGTVWVWGVNGNGQLGNGYADTFSLNMHPAPGKVNGLSNVSAIAANGHIVVLKTDHTLWAWGQNQSGQVGNGTTNPDWPYAVTAPVPVNPF